MPGGDLQGLILAAGRGSRLASSKPKCLVEIGGRPLLFHQLAALREAGVDDVVVVVGDRHERVREQVDREVQFVLNDRYAETNSLYSFWLARERIDDDVLLLNCDVLFPPELLSRLLRHEGSVLAFDSSSGGNAEHMKVNVDNGRLVKMSKQLARGQTCGENVGVMRLAADTARAAFAAAARLVRNGREREWVGSAINAVADRSPIGCLDVAGLPWVEIDFPHDLRVARHRVWPAIEGRGLPSKSRPTRQRLHAALGTEAVG